MVNVVGGYWWGDSEGLEVGLGRSGLSCDGFGGWGVVGV